MSSDAQPQFGFFICRQPIFNRNVTVMGYSLFFYPYPTNPPVTTMDNLQVARALLDTVGDYGLNKLVGDKIAYFPVTRQLVRHLPSTVLPANKVVLQVLKDTPLDEPFMERLESLSKAGYAIAQDQVTVLTEWVGTLAHLTQTFNVLIHGRDPQRISDTMAKLRLSRSKILAEWVETLDEFTYCQRLGFDFFQGAFFCQPRRLITRHVDASRMSVMRTLASIQDPRSDFPHLGKIIAQDAVLSQKLLTMVNSPAFDVPRSITSIEQAVAFMGLKQLRSWMSLLTMASIPGKPTELTSIAILRAKMCELLAHNLGQRQTDVFFVVGLFSVLDALLDLPMQQAISNIPMPSEAVEALLTRSGLPGQILQVTLAYERGDWAILLKTGLQPEMLTSVYLQAVHWAMDLSTSVSG